MLKLVRRPKSPYWVLRGTIAGTSIEESSGTTDKKLAEEIKAKREAELHRERLYGKTSTSTFSQAALAYLENGGCKRFLLPIIDYFGTTPLAKIDLAAIEKCAVKLSPNGSPSTRNRQVFTPTIAVIRHGAKRGMCSLPVIERPKEPEGRVRWLTLPEANRLIDACGEHLRPLVIFLFYTGARIGEALWLDWHEVDLARGHAIFLDTKNDTNRGVPLHHRVVAALANLPNRDGNVFRRPDGLPYEPRKKIDDSAGGRIKNAFDGACGRAGITDFTPHDCRHTFASWHYAANRDLFALQRLGGWKTLSMVQRYAHINVDELAGSIDRLPSLVTENGTGTESPSFPQILVGNSRSVQV